MNNKFLSKTTIASLAIITAVLCACTSEKPVSESEIFFADPTIFVENGKYYLTGTRENGGGGFQILESDNLENWHYYNEDSTYFILKSGEQTFGDKGFWAPQIYKENGIYHFFYTANEQVVAAKADSLTGPYRQNIIRPIDGSEKNIDPFLFKDEDGKYYLYHVRFDNGNYLWSAEYDFDNDSIYKNTLTKCFEMTDAWEKTDNNIWPPIMEGPTVIKLDSIYYLFYSANHYQNPDYAVGYATATSPSGPWTKHPNNPIIHRDIVGENGSGHGDLFMGLDNTPYYVYHIHNNDSTANPRRTRIIPLKFSKNDSTGIYDIIVDIVHVIIPHINQVK